MRKLLYSFANFAQFLWLTRIKLAVTFLSIMLIACISKTINKHSLQVYLHSSSNLKLCHSGSYRNILQCMLGYVQSSLGVLLVYYYGFFLYRIWSWYLGVYSPLFITPMSRLIATLRVRLNDKIRVFFWLKDYEHSSGRHFHSL